MTTIITNTELQRRNGQIAKEVEKTTFTVTVRGKPKMTILPYFEGSENLIQQYQEDYEMWTQKEKLRKIYKESIKSGDSSLIV